MKGVKIKRTRPKLRWKNKVEEDLREKSWKEKEARTMRDGGRFCWKQEVDNKIEDPIPSIFATDTGR